LDTQNETSQRETTISGGLLRESDGSWSSNLCHPAFIMSNGTVAVKAA
jgi:hypothetical protein